MSFDVERMFKFAVTVIDEFAANRQQKTFYAFAIDAFVRSDSGVAVF